MEFLSKHEMTELTKSFGADVAAAPAGVKEIFCKAWPLAKQAIEAALKIIKNPIVVIVLKTAEAAGDALFAALGCPK